MGLSRRKIRSTGDVIAIDIATEKRIKTISLGSLIPGNRPALLPGKPYLYVPESTPSNVALVNTRTEKQVNGGFSCASGAYNVAIAPNGKRVYVTDEFANKVTVAEIQ
jgi:DNA-binding beta-propeller fold protein YncE